MTQPDIGTWAQEIYDGLAPMAWADASNDYALAVYIGAFGAVLNDVDGWVRDDPATDIPGWAVFMDVDRAPSIALPWLAQFVGVTLEPGLSDNAQRARIKGTAGWSRGTTGAIIAAAQQYLTGAQTVIVRERDPAACAAQPAYGLSVITYTSQTPDATAVLNAIKAQKPAGIVLRYVTASGQDYQSLFANNVSYQAVFTKYATYQGVVTDQPGT